MRSGAGPAASLSFFSTSSTIVRTDDGVMIINFWDNAEGRHKMAEDPEIRQAVQDAGMPPPNAKGYEVIQHQTAAHATA